MAVLPVRLFGDPVLRERARPVTSFDTDLRHLVDDMVDTMNAARGAGIAAPQVGVQLRMFVYDVGEGVKVVCNPEVSDPEGTWSYEEGCLSIPGIHVEFERPDVVTLRGQDLDGEPVEIRAGELEGRVFQHETDHCDGVLFLERISKQERKDVMRRIRETLPPGKTSYVPEPGDDDGINEL